MTELFTPLPTSPHRFPDGGAWRVEIPSVEGPLVMAEVLDEADRLDVPVHRISQGSGVMMLTDAEIDEMQALGEARDVEVCLFLGPRGTWDIGGAVHAASGGSGPRARGMAQVGQCLQDAHRAADLGIRNLLVADEGVLWELDQQRISGALPADMRFKSSVLIGPVNAVSFTVMARLGADSINVPSDLTGQHLAEIRQLSCAAVDMYVEAPDDVGGFIRMYEAAELIRVAAPIYLKFGLRNCPPLYPAGAHLLAVAAAAGRERVRRARLTLDLLARSGGAPLPMSAVGDPSLPVPGRFRDG